MGDYDDVELQGAERERVLKMIQDQIVSWGLKMPDVTPLPLHFGLGRFDEIGETEFWIANEKRLGYCGKFLFLFDAQTCPYHHHRLKHETFFVVKGSIRMNVNGVERTMHEGDCLAMPPEVAHSFTGVGPALVLEVSMPSIPQDNFFADTNIGENGII